MQTGAVIEDSFHASTPTFKSHATAEMTNCQHHSKQQQQKQPHKPRQTDDHCMNELSFQFRIVVMPHSLAMRLLLPPGAFLTSLLLLQLLSVTAPVCQAVGYSYTRFSGPVTGPEQKIIVYDGLGGGDGGGTRVDFIAKPAYEFAYGVEDAQARLLQNRQETRDGDAVHGSYSVVDPDGNLRVVKYTADHINGFQAEVTTNGLHTAVHGQNPVSHPTVETHPTPTPSWYFPHAVQQQVQHPDKQAHEDYDDDTNDAKGNDKKSVNKGNGNYEVTDDYEENDNGEEGQDKQKETNTESDEHYDNEDEHEDYDNNEHSAEASKEAASYEEHSEEYY